MIDIPFAVAGGIRSRDQAAACLDAGADKVSINSPALERPDTDRRAGARFRQPVRRARRRQLRARRRLFRPSIYRQRRTRPATPGSRTLDWVREATDRGAGEIVLNCMRRDGVRTGYDIAHTARLFDAVTVPVIASGGAGAPEHFRDAFCKPARAARSPRPSSTTGSSPSPN